MNKENKENKVKLFAYDKHRIRLETIIRDMFCVPKLQSDLIGVG